MKLNRRDYIHPDWAECESCNDFRPYYPDGNLIWRINQKREERGLRSLVRIPKCLCEKCTTEPEARFVVNFGADEFCENRRSYHTDISSALNKRKWVIERNDLYTFFNIKRI